MLQIKLYKNNAVLWRSIHISERLYTVHIDPPIRQSNQLYTVLSKNVVIEEAFSMFFQ